MKAKPVSSKAKPAAPVPPETPAKKARTDWEAVERDYRAGKLTLREMATKHGCTNGRICQVSKEKNWTRGDLQEVVRKATQAALIEQDLSTEVSRVKQGLSDTVAAAVELNKQVILQHRGDLKSTRNVMIDMLTELATTTKSADQLEAMFESLTDELTGPAKMAAAQQFRDFMRLHTRIGSVHKLADALKKVQELERKAFNLDDDSKGGSSGYEDALEDVISEIEGK